MTGLDDATLRQTVRELLRELVPQLAGDHPQPVVLTTDADLDRFVRRLLELFEDPARRAELHSGRLRFTLGPARTEPARSELGRSDIGRTDEGTPYRIGAGAVTERRIAEAAGAGATRLQLDRRAVLTPLARDKARALGLILERRT